MSQEWDWTNLDLLFEGYPHNLLSRSFKLYYLCQVCHVWVWRVALFYRELRC